MPPLALTLVGWSNCRCYLFKDCKTRYMDALLSVARVELFMPGVRFVSLVITLLLTLATPSHLPRATSPAET